MSFTYRYARPALTVDCVVFGIDDELKVLLIQRRLDPFADCWALPGGFVELDENLEQAARRELQEETGLQQVYLEQLYTFGEKNRDPRERVVSVVYYALVKLADHRVKAATDAKQAGWFSAKKVPPLAFDHSRILQVARERLRNKVRYQPIGFELLPPKFTITQIQRVYENILERELDKRNFRKKLFSTKLLVELDELEKGVTHRAARLYRFDHQKYKQLEKDGFNFEI